MMMNKRRSTYCYYYSTLPPRNIIIKLNIATSQDYPIDFDSPIHFYYDKQKTDFSLSPSGSETIVYERFVYITSFHREGVGLLSLRQFLCRFCLAGQ
jgi:hypothetical protein